MIPLAKIDGIKYGIFEEADGREMARLLGETFARRDPPAVAVGLTAEEFTAFVELLCALEGLMAQGLTIIARSAETGEIAGALLAEDSTTAMPEGLGNLSSKFDPIFDLLDNLEDGGAEKVAPGESVHLFLLGVAEKFGGRGIGSELVAQCMANAARKGYRVAVTEATNRTSQHIFRKAGFTVRARGSYGDHRYQGVAYFAGIAEEHGGPLAMARVMEE